MGKEVREKRRIFCCDAARFCLRCLHYFQERFFLTHKFTQLSIHVRTSTCTVYAHIPPRSLSLSSLPTLRLIKLPLPMRPRTRPRCMQYTVQCTVRVDSLPHRKWREIKQQPGTAGPGNMLGCCLIYFHFRWGKLSMRTVLY